MDTLVSIDVFPGPGEREPLEAIERALGWFATVERHCSRFDPESELRRLCAQPAGTPTIVSELLFSALELGLGVSEATDGAFDITVGARLAHDGYDRNYLTGEYSGGAAETIGQASWRDVRLDADRRLVALRRPLLLDLGAVAKGFAIDLAGRELALYQRWAVYAGGDLLLHDSRPQAKPFEVEIRHPRESGGVIETLALANGSVCTSGDYERGHHIVETSGASRSTTLISSTVVAPTAVIADALSTAAFLLGPRRAIRFLEAQAVEGLLFDSDLRRYETRGFKRLRAGYRTGANSAAKA